MKRQVKRALMAVTMVVLGLLLFARFVVLPSEGFPTWEAVWNILIRDGQIQIYFPDGVQPMKAQCDESDSIVSIEENLVTTKIGYSWCMITVEAETVSGTQRRYFFNPQKLNNWNRIRFVPIDSKNVDSEFRMIENGLEQKQASRCVCWEPK